jgi:hypothetical protein
MARQPREASTVPVWRLKLARHHLPHEGPREVAKSLSNRDLEKVDQHCLSRRVRGDRAQAAARPRAGLPPSCGVIRINYANV